VLDLKKALNEKYLMELDSMRILFGGKILKNEDPLKNYNITENSNLTLFISKVVQPNEKKVLPGFDKKPDQSVFKQPELQPQQNVQGMIPNNNNVLQEPGLNEGQLLHPEQQPNPEVLNSFLNQNKLNPERQQMLDQLTDMG